MKLTTLFSAVASMTLTFTLTNAPAYGQGALNPLSVPDHKSGPSAALNAGGLPQPTMKTLQQVEPRTDIQTLSGDSDAAYVIARPGSYYLSKNINSPKPIAISIRSARVTLDLNGFHVTYGGGGGVGNKGVHVISDAHDVTVRNGSASGFKDAFAAFSTSVNNPKNCVFENLIASRCSQHGFLIGESGTIRQCKSWQTGAGIHAENGSLVTHCTVSECFGYGENNSLGNAIFVRKCCTVSHCEVRSNKVQGIIAGSGCILEHNLACENIGTYGIFAGEGSVLRSCVADSNKGNGSFSRGISLEKGCTAIACSASNNEAAKKDSSGSFGVGIFASTDCLVKNCTVEGNDGDGIRAGSGNRLEENQCANQEISAGIRVIGDCNRIDGNHCIGNAYGIHYFGGKDNLIVRNSLVKNRNRLSFQIFGNPADNGVGPISNMAAAALSDHPWANFYRVAE